VQWLERLLRSRERQVDEPRFLNQAAMELPESAMQAIRNEMGHLLENAFELIAAALSLKSGAVRSEEDLRGLVEHSPQVTKIDIDVLYEQRIKTLYSAITVYISQVQASASEHYGEELYQLRKASLNIVEAVKDIKHLQKNMVRFTQSDNRAIRAQYNRLRLQLAGVLREVASIQSESAAGVSQLSLDAVKLAIEEDDIIANGKLDQLIRKNAISAEMATSLMNDSAYAYDVADNLIQMGRVLFAPLGQDAQDVESELLLNDAEISELIEEEQNPAAD